MITREGKILLWTKSNDWLETNDNKRNKQSIKKLEKGKEEENQNKIQKESGAKKNVIKQKKE